MISIPRYLLENRKPVLVCSRRVLREQFEAIRDTGVEVFYSTKTNPERKILNELYKLGAGFSVSDPRDLLLALSVGAKPGDVIYYERGLDRERAAWLVGLGCRNFIVETRTAFNNLLAEIGGDSTILVRVRSERPDDDYSGDYVPGVREKELGRMLLQCRREGIRTGILHHSSSQVEDPLFWRRKFEYLGGLPEVDVVNIGGGVPIGYGTDVHGGVPIGYGTDVHGGVLDEIKRGIGKINAGRVVAEPGRFIVGPACSLVTRAKLVDGGDAVVNCSVYSAHIDTIIANLVLPCRTVGSDKKAGGYRRYRILGSSLCPLDVFNPGVRLPRISEGTPIIFDNAGAYNFSSAFASGPGIESYVID